MEDKDYKIDLLQIVEILKANFRPIIRMTGLIVAVGILFLAIALLFFPVYKSEAILRVKESNKSGGLSAMLAGLGGAFLGGGDSSTQMGTYVEILKSRGVVVPVIEAIEETGFSGNYPRYEDYLQKNISVDVVPMTDILKVSVSGKTKEQAQKANQLLLQGFLKRVSELNSTEKGATKEFLQERVKNAREDLDKAESALQKFKEDNKIISPAANAEIFAQRITEIEKQAALNQVALEAAEAKLNSINGQLSSNGASSADNRTIQLYNAELAKLEAERISYLEKYTEKHPKMIEITETIANLKAKIREEIDKVAALQAPSDNAVHQGLVAGKYMSEGEVAVARQRAEALQQIIDRNNAELEKLPAVEKGYIKVERDFKVANEVYLMLTKKLEETKITELQNPDNVLVVDEPTLPDKRAFPAVGMSLVVFVLLGLILSSGYLLAKEFLNKTIWNEEDIKQYLEVPVLGVISDENRLAGTQSQKQSGFWGKVKEFVWKD